MRISRTAEGKTYAIIYDYIFDHPIFIYQFYNRRKRLYRLKAYLQCTQVHEVVEELVYYMTSLAQAREPAGYKMKNLLKYFDDIVIPIDELEPIKVD